MKFKYPKWHRLYKQVKTGELISPAQKSGLPPGSLVHIGEAHHKQSIVSAVQYNAVTLNQYDTISLTEITTLKQQDLITWINVDGLSDTAVIEHIGLEFAIHPLILEDILSTHQRPKLEEYDDYLYLVLKGISVDSDTEFKPRYEQVSILLLDNFIITFKERSDNVFNPIYNRLKNQKGRLRQFGPDYLSYVILDTIVDEYFVVIDKLDDMIVPLEDRLLTDPANETLQTIQHVRRELITIKRNVSPLRELLTSIQRSDTALIKDYSLRYFDDVLDHVLRVSDSLESYRERLASMQDIYLSSISNKMNETMKVLTIFASIFIPQTFIVGIYGMNFEYMPELKLPWAYPVLWGVLITTSIGLLIYFKKKKWL